VGKYCRAGQATDVNMGHEHCMLDTEGSNMHSEYVTVTSFPLQQWLCKRAAMLRHMYISCLVIKLLAPEFYI